MPLFTRVEGAGVKKAVDSHWIVSLLEGAGHVPNTAF
jgi:hypothetical protein